MTFRHKRHDGAIMRHRVCCRDPGGTGQRCGWQMLLGNPRVRSKSNKIRLTHLVDTWVYMTERSHRANPCHPRPYCLNESGIGRPAFSLIELLTVVAIISLLIAILVPSLAAARDQARRTKVASLLSAIDRGLEMFAADFGQYPDSSNPTGKHLRTDPIVGWPDVDGSGIPPIDNVRLTGAHWLARAMAGHDLNGVDAAGHGVGNGRYSSLTYNSLLNPDPNTGRPGTHAARKGPYLDIKFFARDNDREKFPGPIDTSNAKNTFRFQPTKRMLVYDESFGSPVLYYRANTKACNPFCRTGRGDDRMGSPSGDQLGMYCHQDNSKIAGDDQWQELNYGWDFAGTGQRQRLYTFGVQTGQRDVEPGSFIAYMQNPAAPGNLITPHHPDRFILVTAGKDGLFGTDDDVNNFKNGL